MHAVWLGGPPLLPFLLAQPGIQTAGKKSAVSSERLGTPRQTPHTDTIGSPSEHSLLCSTVLKRSPLAAKSGPCYQSFQSALFELLLDVNHKTRNARHFRKCINIKEIQISQRENQPAKKKDKSYFREIIFKSFFFVSSKNTRRYYTDIQQQDAEREIKKCSVYRDWKDSLSI